jgi:hypothetical protein
MIIRSFGTTEANCMHDMARQLRAGIILFALGLLAPIMGCAGGGAPSPVTSAPGTTTTFILVRHAEKADASPESPLSPAGRDRALALVEAVSPLGVTAIYCPALRRNKETVQPLADRLGLKIIAIPAWRLLNTHHFAETFVQETLSAHAGGVVLWSGNSSASGSWGSNLQEIYQRLGGHGQGPRAYDDLVVIMVGDKGTVDIQKRHYGKAVP